MLLVIIGIIIVVLLNILVGKLINYEIDKNYRLSVYHYLMLGMNKQTTGTFSVDDVKKSLAISNYEERKEYNKEVFWQRLQEMSGKDFIDFYMKKILANYNDGVFSLGKEGNTTIVHYDEEYTPKNYMWGQETVVYVSPNEKSLSNMLKEIYCNTGELYYMFCSIMQIIWIFILILTIIGAVLKRANYKSSLIYLTIIGITVFLFIFEVRARYLYIYSPYFIITAIMGIDILYEKLKK